MNTIANHTPANEFIGRKPYLEAFNQFIHSDHSRILFFHGPGGVGKTWLLEKMAERLSGKTDCVMIDLFTSDHRSIEGLNYGIVKLLKPLVAEQHFRNYESRVEAFEAAQKEGQYTATKSQQVRQAFIEDCAALSPQKFVVFLDTFEVVQHGAVGDWVINVLGRKLDNFKFVIAGRREWPAQDHMASKLVDGFTKEEALEYYCHREEKDITALDNEAKDLIATLWEKSAKNPLLISLALEWFDASILQPGILQRFSKEQFEEKVIAPIRNIGQGTFGSPEMDTAAYYTLLMMAFFNQRFSVEFLDQLVQQKKWVNLGGLSTFEVLDHLEKNFHFVKRRPDNTIQLHDEMERLAMQYLWPGFDREGDYSKELAKQALDWYDRMIAEAPNDWVAQELQAERLLYLLRSDLKDGWNAFIRLFDTGVNEHHLNVCDIALTQIQPFQQKLSSEQGFDLDFRRVQLNFEYQMYEEADLYALSLANQPMNFEQTCKLYIQWGNIKIRLGKFKDAISHLEKALQIGQEHELVKYQIQALNVLGYVQRLTGNHKLATECYQKARDISYDNGIANKDYYLIINNLSIVSSYSDKDAAIDEQMQVVSELKKFNDPISYGASLSTLGSLYYQANRLLKAEEKLTEALNVFDAIGHQEWKGRVLSWRGATYQDLQQYDKAEEDLLRSIEIGFAHDKARTLCRLGRVYMSQKSWDKAEYYMQASYECARILPDYVYWLGALARQIVLAAEKKDHSRMEEYEGKLQEFQEAAIEPDKNSLGIAYLGLCRLAVRRYVLTGDQKFFDTGLNYLKEGLVNVVEYGRYARTDVGKRLTYIENDFAEFDNPQIMRQIAKQLEPVFRNKEKSNLAYGVVVFCMHRWSRWGEEIKNG